MKCPIKNGVCQECGARFGEMCMKTWDLRKDKSEELLSRIILIAMVLAFAGLCLVLWYNPYAN